tara:strand:+ start:773 stop:2986 length:2214 start_codon:yes stop_codon:yes gene_type:complete
VHKEASITRLLYCFWVIPAAHLGASETPSLPTVSIIATRSEKSVLETAGSDSVVTSGDMERQGSISIREALKYEPGVSIPFDFTGSDSAVPYMGGGEKSINIRGMEGNRISISVDGIRQPQEFQVAGGMSGAGRIYFDPATLGQLELFKSASSSLYGSDAMGGAINGRTVNPRGLLGKTLKGSKISNTITYSSVNESLNDRLVAGYGNGNWGYSIVYSFREGHERKNNGNIPSNPQDSQSNAGVLKALTRKGSWDFEGTVDLFTQDSSTDVASITNSTVTHWGERKRNRFSLQADLLTDNGSMLVDNFSSLIYVQESRQSSFNLQEDRADDVMDRRRRISYQSNVTGVDLEAKKAFETELFKHSLILGVEATGSKVESRHHVNDLMDNGNQVSLDKIDMDPCKAQEIGVYVSDEIKFGIEEKWALTPSLRFDRYEIIPLKDAAFQQSDIRKDARFDSMEYKNTVLGSPGISLLYRWTEEINWYCSYNHGIRNPSVEELNGFFAHPPTVGGQEPYIYPNPELKEETSDSFEIGSQGYFEGGSFELAIYKNFYDGFIDLTQQPNDFILIYSNENIGKVEVHGIELSLKKNLSDWLDSVEGLSAGISTSWSEGKRVDLGKPLSSIEPWKTVFFIEIAEASNKWSGRLSSTFRAAKGLSEIDPSDGDVPIDDSLVLDLVTWRKLNDTWQVRAGINNLTNQKYFIWSSARRGGFHGSNAGNSTGERNTEPGINGFFSLTASF